MSQADQIIALRAERDLLIAQREADWNPYRQALSLEVAESALLRMAIGTKPLSIEDIQKMQEALAEAKRSIAMGGRVKRDEVLKLLKRKNPARVFPRQMAEAT